MVGGQADLNILAATEIFRLLPVEIVEQRTVGPTLGAEAIDTSARAAVSRSSGAWSERTRRFTWASSAPNTLPE